jgi:predicted nucleic acid binding AN1-type Zn finger protein
MDTCQVCGKAKEPSLFLTLYKCIFCGKTFCDKHRQPQKHHCLLAPPKGKEM